MINCSWGKNCLKLSIYFYILLLLSPLAYKCWPSLLIKMNSSYLIILCVNFGWILPRFWRKDSCFAHFYTNSFALIRESFAFIRESYAFIREIYALIRERYALIRESFALIRESYALFREKYKFFLYENKPNRLSYFSNIFVILLF